jgi:hypothetical protein
MPSRERGRCALFLGLVLIVPTAALAQIPDEFTNLQVLPKDIEKRELVSAMRGFASALGVRCNYCHPGPESLQGMDFATDENPHKVVARGMMKMVADINQQVQSAAGESGQPRVEVSCMTCHRGQELPRLTRDVLVQTYEEGGLDALVAEYRRLREEYYGTHTYDFSPTLLSSIAESWIRADNLDDAQTLLEFNLTENPDSGYTYVLLGRIHAQRDDKDAAIAAWQKALEIEPENEWVKRMLQRIQE